MLNWMAWSAPTALFFAGLALALAAMTLLALRRPETPRVGALGLATTRGDRFFLSLLSAAFLHLGWIGLAPEAWPLWGASALSLACAAALFRWV